VTRQQSDAPRIGTKLRCKGGPLDATGGGGDTQQLAESGHVSAKARVVESVGKETANAPPVDGANY
jgi:hypothetical protein